MKKVLILEDEVSIRSFVVINLKRAGYEAIEAGTGMEALEQLKRHPDVGVAILDIMLPDIDGFEVCRSIRATDKQIGIIMLTARSQEMDKVTGLMTGADDYITKPFSPAELTARIDALFRRVGNETASDPSEIRQGPFVLNTRNRALEKDGVRIKLTQVISVLQNFVLPTLSAFILNRFLRINGAWLGFLSGELLTLAFIAVFVFRENKRVSFTAENFSLIPDDFGIPDEDCFERSITDPEDVSRTSEAAARFCSSRGLEERLSRMIALCVEEMANNTIQHSFHKDDDEHYIDIRILIKEDGPVIRIRDNCVHFDPVKYFEIHKEDEGREDHIGIRMVMGMVKKVNYVNTLGLNNLTLTI